MLLIYSLNVSWSNSFIWSTLLQYILQCFYFGGYIVAYAWSSEQTSNNYNDGDNVKNNNTTNNNNDNDDDDDDDDNDDDGGGGGGGGGGCLQKIFCTGCPDHFSQKGNNMMEFSVKTIKPGVW